MNIQIGNKTIGKNSPCFIVAEMSGNHNGDINQAIKILHEAKKIGVDAVKLQTYTADSITMKLESKDFLLADQSPWSEYKTLWDLYDKASTPPEWHERLFNEAKKIDLEIFSTPFDESSVDLLDQLGVAAFKIASPEINHIPLIKKAAMTNKPIILSAGVANDDDIQLALQTIHENSANPKIALLQCNSAYPSPYEDSNLKTIANIAEKYEVIPGFSDHTMGIHCALGSVALGSKILEKHLYLEGDETVDSFFSLTPDMFEKMIVQIRELEDAIGSISYDISPSAIASVKGRRSLYVSKNIQAGTTLTSENIKCVRPSYGLHPKYYNYIIGKKVNVNLKKGDRLLLENIDD